MRHLVVLALVLQVSFAAIDESQEESSRENAITQKYEPTWESLDKRPLPQWYDDAKVGIFIHWGVYSVPSYGTEWFWDYWQGQNVSSYINFMKKNYKPGFTYQEFASDFTAELFNATEWALLFKDSGAKYVVLTSKHHEGFALWPSKYSFGWNSMDVGPKIDIIKELASGIRANTDIKFGLYHSLFEWFNRLYNNDKMRSFSQNDFVTKKVLPELNELVQLYQPEILWSDGDGEAPPTYWNSTEFIAWLYNESPVRETVVTNDRWGIGTACKHGDFYTCADRYNPGVLQHHKWENCMTLDQGSWGHRGNAKLEDYLTTKQLIDEIASTVSCGGNILINVGPTKYGTIEPIFEERLRDMGKWLKINGEAIYSAKPWVHQNDTVTKGIWYTSKKDEANQRLNIYAMILNYPFDTNEIQLYALANYIGPSIQVSVLGLPDQHVEWHATKKMLQVKLPAKHLMDKAGLDYVWTLKISIELS